MLNDVADYDKDRLHPTKRLRPVASGALSRRAALWIRAVGGNPSELFLSDRALLLNTLPWILTVVLILYLPAGSDNPRRGFCAPPKARHRVRMIA